MSAAQTTSLTHCIDTNNRADCRLHAGQPRNPTSVDWIARMKPAVPGNVSSTARVTARRRVTLPSSAEQGGPVLDIRFATRMAVRTLRAAPAVSLLAVLCIGLGIGAVTTVYSTASAFTFHPLPQLADPDRLVFVADAPAQAPERGDAVAPATFN